MVPGGRDIELVHLGARFSGIQNQFEEGVLGVFWQPPVDLLRPLRESSPLREDGIRFPIVFQAERAWFQKLRLAPAVVLRIFGDNVRDFSCIGRTELTRGPPSAEFRA